MRLIRKWQQDGRQKEDFVWLTNKKRSLFFLLLTGCCISTLLALCYLSDQVTGFNFDYYTTWEVWHCAETAGLLAFKGPRKTLVNCHLVLIEGRDVEKKSEILAELALVQSSTIEEVDFGTMVSIVQACEDLQSQRVLPGLVPGQNETASGHVNMWTLLKGIVPGTKWCGMNDLADNYHDLAQGSNFLVDKCCRAHDHCPVKVHSFGSNYGITNYHPYTKSHCACDDIFYDCLKEIASSIVPSGKASAQMATTMGQIYFNVLQLECAEPNYPKVCLHTTKALPGSKGHGMQREKVVPQKRFFWDIFGSSQYSPESKEIEDWQEICTQWVNDTDATPTLSFRNPKRLF